MGSVRVLKKTARVFPEMIRVNTGLIRVEYGFGANPNFAQYMTKQVRLNGAGLYGFGYWTLLYMFSIFSPHELSKVLF